jgi:hypothetical protein
MLRRSLKREARKVERRRWSRCLSWCLRTIIREKQRRGVAVCQGQVGSLEISYDFQEIMEKEVREKQEIISMGSEIRKSSGGNFQKFRNLKKWKKMVIDGRWLPFGGSLGLNSRDNSPRR